VGAAVYIALDTVITKYTDYWQAVLGGILVLLVIVFPHGLVGVLHDRPTWRRAGRG
jgi:branched-chain amino acid transport system permease protein